MAANQRKKKIKIKEEKTQEKAHEKTRFPEHSLRRALEDISNQGSKYKKGTDNKLRTWESKRVTRVGKQRRKVIQLVFSHSFPFISIPTYVTNFLIAPDKDDIRIQEYEIAPKLRRDLQHAMLLK